jgi:hypothetical protein
VGKTPPGKVEDFRQRSVAGDIEDRVGTAQNPVKLDAGTAPARCPAEGGTAR